MHQYRLLRHKRRLCLIHARRVQVIRVRPLRFHGVAESGIHVYRMLLIERESYVEYFVLLLWCNYKGHQDDGYEKLLI